MKRYSFPAVVTMLLALMLAVSCKKFDFNYPSQGEAIGTFQLSAPADNTSMALNSATPNNVVSIAWSAAAPGLHTQPSYIWIAALTSGNISQPLIRVPSDSGGTAPHLTLTQQALDGVLSKAGVAAASSVSLVWSVLAANGTDTVQAGQVYHLNLTRFGDGTTPFVLFAPASSTNVITINPSSTSSYLGFLWQKSVPGNSANGVTYKVLFTKRVFDANNNEIPPDFTKPLMSWAADGAGSDTSLQISYYQMDSALTKNGITQANVAQLDWTVVATSGAFPLQSTYINQLYLLREVDMYIAGSFQGWDPTNGIQMIPDSRSGLQNNMFWEYIYLPANAQFKFTQGKSWSINFGTDNAGNLVSNGSNNFQVTNAGVYRITINVGTLKYDISPGRMGFVGDAVTNVGWNPPGVFPASAMSLIGTNKFLGLYNFSAGGWKMIDNNQWNDGSNSVSETRSYGSSDSVTLLVNGPNMPNIATGGMYRVIWDGTALKTLNYSVTNGAIYVIGDATAGGWTNNSGMDATQRPALAYQGNGVWKGSVALAAGNIKFIVEQGSWDFSYGGAGGVLSYQNGANITIASAGTYTITVDEYQQTYSVQ